MENSDESFFIFETKRKEYLSHKQALFSQYMQLEPQFKENLFLCLNGSQERRKQSGGVFSYNELQTLFSSGFEETLNGGYFLRSNQKGICINPTDGFLERFCELGHHLWEIDCVIVTRQELFASKELERIHTLNSELNHSLVSYGQEPHVIHYLLHPLVYARHVSQLRPHYREEKRSIVLLETFRDIDQDIDSLEQYSLGPEIKISYAKANSALMIRLEFTKKDKTTLSFGYLSGSCWTEKCKSFFQGCDLLLLGFGHTDPQDLEKLAEQNHCLGYFGLAKASQELPEIKLLLVSEFSDSQGDIRLEVMKKLKKEVPPTEKVELPLDQGFMLNLDTLEIKTGAQKFPPYQFTACHEVHAICPEGAFSPLIFLANAQIL